MGLKEAAITLGIIVLFSAFILVSIDAFYERPQYDDFCDYSQRPEFPGKEPINCTNTYTVEEEACVDSKGEPRYNYDNSGCQIFKECNYCNKDYQAAEAKYSNFIFLLLAPLGALAIIIGVYFGIEFIGSGFMFSGIFLMFYGTIQNFRDLNKFTRVFVVFIELLLVLFIAYKKVIPDKSKKTTKKKK